jgi:hypothetical protein
VRFFLLLARRLFVRPAAAAAHLSAKGSRFRFRGMLRDRLAMATAVARSDLCMPDAVFATPYSMIQRGV